MEQAPVLTDARDPDLITDLEIIALSQPGRGQALKRIVERSGLTHRELAEKLGYDPASDVGRTTMHHYYGERRQPSAQTTRQILVACNVDRKLLLEKFGTVLGTEITAIAESRDMLVTLRNELMFTFDEFARRDIIFSNTAEKVLLFQSFKAFDDVRAAQLFFERYDKHEEEKRLKGETKAVNVTPQSATWLADPYKAGAKDTTTSGKSDAVACEEWDVYSQVVEVKENGS